jgi:addiction module HigA family antidote
MGRLRNPHPGEILREEFLSAIGMSQNQLAHTIGVPGNRIHAIVNGTRAPLEGIGARWRAATAPR